MSGIKSEAQPALLSVAGRVATITLNRPDTYNSIDRDMALRLRDLAKEIMIDQSIAAVVLRGEGRGFCAGGDIAYMATNLPRIGDAIRDLLNPFHDFLCMLQEMPKLVIASVHGSAAGAGLSLASMCDLCIASADARFTPAYAKIGVSPDGGGTYGLARAVGPRRALQIFLGEDGFTAEQAANWGLVSVIADPTALAEQTDAYVARLLRTSPYAIANTKRLLRGHSSVALRDQLNEEMESLIQCMSTQQFADSVHRFANK